MNTRTVARRSGVASVLLLCLLVTACGGGGSTQPKAVVPPEGYVVALTRVDGRTFDVILRRTLDEAVLGLQFDLGCPAAMPPVAQVNGVQKLELLQSGYAGAGIDEHDGRRIKVGLGMTGADSLRGVGDLLAFRMVFADEVAGGLAPTIESVRVFRIAAAGQFAVDAASERPWTLQPVP